MFSRRNIIIGILIFLILFTWFLWKSTHPANLKITIAPSVAKVTVDGEKNIKTGSYRLSLGTHKLRATMDGFATVTRSFTISTRGVTTVLLVLNPNSQAGYDYLNSHPQEETLREQLGGQSFKSNSQNITSANPLIKSLPHIASNSSYRIDYGLGANNTTSKVPIYITAVDTTAAQAAENWITSKGYNTNSLDIKVIIEPMLSHLPYKTTDFSLAADFTNGSNGEPKLAIDATIHLSGADEGDPTAATAQYKQEVLNYISSCGVDPANYTINYTTQNG